MSASAPSDRLGSDASGHPSQPSTHPPISVVPAGNLTTLLRRLEAATSRLEDIASSASTFDSASPNAVPTGSTATKASASAPELAIVTPSISQQTVKPEAPPLPISIQDMDTLIDTDVKAFIDSSKGLDPLVEEQAAAVAKGFADQRRFLLVTTKAKRPDQSSQTFMDLLKDLQQDLGTAGDIKDSNRGAPVKEHLAMVAEGISTLQWLVLEGKPADTVGEMIGGAQMYGNRVLKNYKEGDQAHVKFVRSYYALLNALKDYIKKHYPMGVTWNASGVDAAQAMREIDAGPTTNGTSAAAGGPPPPPPPPPLPNFDNMPAPPPPPPGAAPKAAAGGDMGAVFDQLNRGESVTKGLKKVDPSQMTHKNPELRAASVVPGEDISRSRSPGPQIKPKPQSMRQNSTNLTPTPPKKEPKKELDGNKWLIENFDSPSQPITIDVSLSQSILITACKNTTIILKGKANAISIDNSPRLQILVETLVSSVDVIKSPNFAIQITGAVPTILLDQVDGASLYLSKESLACEVFTSKCSSVNLVLPPESEEADDSKECPLPEQIRTYIKGGKLVSEIVEHAG